MADGLADPGLAVGAELQPHEAVRRPSRSLNCLERLRDRVRRAFLYDGTASLLLLALALCVLSFLLDYFLELPWGVRVVLLFKAVICLGIALDRRLLRPLALRLGDDDMAGLIERSHPELRQVLVTAVELTRDNNEGARYVSSSLLDATIQEAEERVGRVNLSRILEYKGVRRKTLCGLVLAALVVSGILWKPNLAGAWLSRNVFLTGRSWPRHTTLELVEPTSFPAVVAVGDPFEVAVRAVKGEPSTVVVESEGEDGYTRIDTMAKSSSGVFRKVFTNVTRSFAFRVRGGDHELGDHEVEVRLRPRIDARSVKIWCEYPEYIGEHLDHRVTPQDTPIRFPNLKLPIGTKVRYEMAANVPIDAAYFVFKGVSSKNGEAATRARREESEESWPMAGAVPLTVTEGVNFSGEFSVEESGHYFFQLQTVDGFRSGKLDRFRIDAVADRKPYVKVVVPRRMTEEVSPAAEVLIRIRGYDDYQISRAAVEGLYFPLNTEEGQPRTFALERIETEEGVEGDESAGDAGDPKDSETLDDRESLTAGAVAHRSQRVRAVYPAEVSFPLSVLAREPRRNTAPGGGAGAASGEPSDTDTNTDAEPTDTVTIEPGARFQFLAQCVDSGGNVGESQVYVLQVVSKEELEKRLTDQLMVIRDQLQDVLRRQRSARKDLEEFRKGAASGAGIDPKDLGKVANHRRAQERIGKRLEREFDSTARVLAKAAANKVGDRQWRDWVESIQAEIQRLRSERSRAVVRSLREVEKDVLNGSLKSARLTPALSEQMELENDLEMLIAKITEFGDLNAFIQRLRSLRDRQREIQDATRALNQEPEDSE